MVEYDIQIDTDSLLVAFLYKLCQLEHTAVWIRRFCTEAAFQNTILHRIIAPVIMHQRIVFIHRAKIRDRHQLNALLLRYFIFLYKPAKFSRHRDTDSLLHREIAHACFIDNGITGTGHFRQGYVPHADFIQIDNRTSA